MKQGADHNPRPGFVADISVTQDIPEMTKSLPFQTKLASK
jgi:hypothetical protein